MSIATVSRALRGTGPVAAKTRERVLRAVEELMCHAPVDEHHTLLVMMRYSPVDKSSGALDLY
ncbi:hypothetical protein GCM10009555_004930 [Acrocarpospora macrocephala]|uniref:HTH lacI-type domain-containing protein n=1 Tax=Acrocarpospora macrocephala TaxID=150177 RepID=A0A5M3WZH6_9ACTN|nr:hypothetical protein Amac_068960 [Acrocarpospora macrocephala]